MLGTLKENPGLSEGFFLYTLPPKVSLLSNIKDPEPRTTATVKDLEAKNVRFGTLKTKRTGQGRA